MATSHVNQLHKFDTFGLPYYCVQNMGLVAIQIHEAANQTTNTPEVKPAAQPIQRG